MGVANSHWQVKVVEINDIKIERSCDRVYHKLCSLPRVVQPGIFFGVCCKLTNCNFLFLGSIPLTLLPAKLETMFRAYSRNYKRNLCHPLVPSKMV